LKGGLIELKSPPFKGRVGWGEWVQLSQPVKFASKIIIALTTIILPQDTTISYNI
jgi:hypothetical protein